MLNGFAGAIAAAKSPLVQFIFVVGAPRPAAVIGKRKRARWLAREDEKGERRDKEKD
jgi:hypothetical protein